MAYSLVPVAALLLFALYPGRRPFYDHLIFSLHSLSFQLIIVAVLGLIDNYSNWGNLLVFVMAAHLFVHMRGVYGSSSAGTVTRMALLGLGTLIAYSILTIAWVAAAYFELTI